MATLAIRVNLGPRVPLDVVTQICTDINAICDLADGLDRQTATNVSRIFADERYSSLLREVQSATQQLKVRLESPRSDRESKLLHQLSLYELFSQLDQLIAMASATSSRPASPNLQAIAYLNLTQGLLPTPAVVSVRYGSPWEIILSNPGWATGGVGASIYALLLYIRDFSAKREKAWAEARKAHAEADLIEADARIKNAEADKMEAEADEAHLRAMESRTKAQFRAELMESLLAQVRDGRLMATPDQLEAAVTDAAISAAFGLSQQAFDFEELPEDEASSAGA